MLSCSWEYHTSNDTTFLCGEGYIIIVTAIGIVYVDNIKNFSPREIYLSI